MYREKKCNKILYSKILREAKKVEFPRLKGMTGSAFPKGLVLEFTVCLYSASYCQGGDKLKNVKDK